MTPQLNHPLESFFQDYLETAGGACERIEPQVYDMFPPPGLAGAEREDELLRVSFDPEALAEHPGSQFLTLGTPLLDHMLADAQARGRYARATVLGLNTRPYDLPNRLGRAMKLPEKARLEVQETEVVAVTTAIFWFAASYVADQKEQELFQIGLERHHAREVRHLDQLLDPQRLDESPLSHATPADQVTLGQAYDRARQEVVRTVSATANQRRRELAERHHRQRERMNRYYQDLLEEIDEQDLRTADAEQRRASRRRAAMQERELRLAELSRKYALRVQLALTNLLEIEQPKVRIHTILRLPGRGEASLRLIWDPFTELLEPPDCPACHRPTYALRPASRPPYDWRCPACSEFGVQAGGF